MSQSNYSEVAVKGSAAILVAMAGAAKAQDLQGVYGGLSLGKGSGDFYEDFSLNDTYSLDGTALGGFVGYNHVVGDWLFGAELAITGGSYEGDTDFGAPIMETENLRDFKLRAGRTFGNTLVYGLVGRSTADIDMWGPSQAEADGDASGTALGLGFETALGARSFVGGEYISRDLDLSSGPAFYVPDGVNLNTLSLRLGLRF